MVMSKVSKAIAASFLCLTINAGGATNAMDQAGQSAQFQAQFQTQFDKEIKDNNINNLNMPEFQKKDVIDINKIDAREASRKNENDNDDDNKDKTPDGEKSIWRWLLPVITGFGGLVLGIGLGKFAL